MVGGMLTPERLRECSRRQLGEPHAQGTQVTSPALRDEIARTAEIHRQSVRAGAVDPGPGSAMLRPMASVLWLDFEGVVVEPGLNAAVIAEFGRVPDETSGTIEQALVASVSEFDADRDEVVEHVRQIARPVPGLADLVGWAQWHGWLPIVVTTALDVCVDTVLDDAGLDRVTRHCGRTRQVYRWRLSYASPRGVELEEGFLNSYAATFRAAGDLVVHVGGGVDSAQAARSAYAVCAGSPLRDALGDGHERLHSFETLAEVTEILDREGEAWRASFSSTTAAAG